MKIVIIGGHLTPALSVIEKLPKDVEILYVGRKYALEGDRAVSLEYEVVTQKGINFSVLKTGRLQRSLTRHTIPSLTKIPYGFVQALAILKKFKPNVVIGFGGYVSFPVILAAKSLKIPIVIHEQTMDVGAANKIVSRFADKICISFDTSFKYFPKDKTILTGNPLRDAIIHPSKKYHIESNNSVIYITGGNLGSHVINTLVEKCLSRLLEKYSVIHQTGASLQFKDFERLVILKEGLNINKRNKYVVTKYFSPEEIGSIFKASNLVVSRAGINTVSELIILEKPALLIPLPVSQKNEQIKNAQFFKNSGLGEVAVQNNLTPDSFLNIIEEMMKSIENYKLNEEANNFPRNAAERIVKVIYEIRKNSN